MHYDLIVSTGNLFGLFDFFHAKTMVDTNKFNQ